MKKRRCVFVLLVKLVILFFPFLTDLAAQERKNCSPLRIFHNLLGYHQMLNHNVSESEKLDKESRQAFQKGDRMRAEILIRQAIAELDKLGPRPELVCSEQQLIRSAGNKESDDNSQVVPLKMLDMLRNVETKPPPEGASVYNNSPFGIFGPYSIMFDEPVGTTEQELYAQLLDLGATWVQEMPIWLAKLPPGINLYSRIGMAGENKILLNKNNETYTKILTEQIAKLKHRVKVYEVGTEPNGPPPMGWAGDGARYAKHLRFTYQEVKRECPECIVVFGGLGGVGKKVDESIQPARFLDQALAAGAAGAFDAFEFKQHMQNADEYTAIGARMKVYGKIMAKYGLDINKIPVFIEVATHDGQPRFPDNKPLWFLNSVLKKQSEAEQAAGLVKIYVYSLAQGVDKIFWNLVMEHHQFGGSEDNPFDLYGLVHNPHNQDGKKGKKLAYYSYKKMVELLGKADFLSLRTLKDEDGVHLYRFMVEQRPLWVSWSDKGPVTIEVEGLRSAAATVVQSVPSARSGIEVRSYDSAFLVTCRSVRSSGNLLVQAGKEPVYIMDR